MNTLAEQEGQTTPIVVTGTDIFKFGASDTAPGPGEEDHQEQEPATPAPDADHPGEARDENAEGGSGKVEEAPPPAAAPAQRFKSHEEAERGYRELQGKTTRAEQEAAEARRKLAELEAAQAAQNERRVADARRAEADQAIDDYMAERTEKALEEIEALDPDDPEHRKKVARIYARRDSDVRKFAQNPAGKDGKPIGAATEGDQQVSSPPLPAERPPPAPPVVPAAAESRRVQVREYIDGRARAAQIDPEDELWVGVSLTTPTKDADGKSLSLDEQIEWTISRYNERRAAIQARARQAAHLPMGEGASAPRSPGSAGGDTAPTAVGLGDAIARANERRRLG
jgi:chaperonin cofactor prefoldin